MTFRTFLTLILLISYSTNAKVITSGLGNRQPTPDHGGLTIDPCILNSDYICLKCDLSNKSFHNYCAIRNVSGSDLSDSDLEAINAEDSAFDNTVLALSYAYYGNFKNGSFYGADFYEARYKYANFEGAQFKLANAFNAEFHNANFSNARLRGNFNEAEFAGANLTGADLSYVKMKGAKFGSGTIFSNTNVHKADFRGVNGTQVTFFSNTNLVGMVGIPLLDNNIAWDGATCPDGTFADTNGSTPTCVGHFIP